MSRVLIFGATSAIAAQVARRYAARGARLYLVGRDRGKLERLAARLGPAIVGVCAADLDDTGAAAGLVGNAVAALGGLDLAIIAQGLLGDQLASERDYAAAERVVRTNLLSVVALLVPLAQHLEAAAALNQPEQAAAGGGAGAIAVLSSVAGDRGRPRNYTYGAAKGALNVYLQGLRTRLWARGIAVHTLKLGPVDTPMTADHRKTLVFARAETVADGVVAAIDRGRGGATYLPWFWRPIMATVRRLPEPVLQRLSFLAGR